MTLRDGIEKQLDLVERVVNGLPFWMHQLETRRQKEFANELKRLVSNSLLDSDVITKQNIIPVEGKNEGSQKDRRD